MVTALKFLYFHCYVIAVTTTWRFLFFFMMHHPQRSSYYFFLFTEDRSSCSLFLCGGSGPLCEQEIMLVTLSFSFLSSSYPSLNGQVSFLSYFYICGHSDEGRKKKDISCPGPCIRMPFHGDLWVSPGLRKCKGKGKELTKSRFL